MRPLLSLVALCGIAYGQANPYDSTFSVTKSTSLSSATEVLTVAHPATSNKSARFIGLYAYCSAACTITLERGATPTAGTAATIVNANPANSLAATTTCTATSGTTITSTVVINVYNLTAGGWVWLDGTPYQMPATKADSLTLRTNSITASVVLQAIFQEL